ncbi:hypothetical protein Bpfe_024338 [Biomphalaria pfeifferi]|uniref:Uncharacterized protein n=1 Tax=Biomphalaria pfeifferi TaxID=112525 RepID=A0AAD8B2S0_BIOPF|nr:hypothetical protein Bpfe_024338 [Biomphalaria pfeifferi]
MSPGLILFLLGSLLHSAKAGLNDGEIAGISIASIAVFALIIGIILACRHFTSPEHNYGGVSSAKYGMRRNQSD